MLVNYWKILFLILFTVWNQAVIAQSTLLMEEDFDLLSGTNISGQHAWTMGASGTNKVDIISPGLTFPDYPGVATSNAVAFTPLTDRVQRNFEGVLSGNYYYSFLINVSSAGSGEFFAGFYSSSAFRGRAYIKADGEGFQFGLLKSTASGVAPTYTSGTPYSFGTTYLVVVKYEFVQGAQNDKVNLYVNPDLKSEESDTPTIGPLTDNGNDVSANVFALQGRNNSGNFVLDGIRIGTDWAAIKGISSENHFVELPKCISSHMVLQRDVPIKLWGWGLPGDTLIVEFARQSQIFKDSVTIAQDKRWFLQLPAQSVCLEPCELKFQVKNRRETLQVLEDILIGDVWFAGGQSNMEKKVNHLLEVEQYVQEADNYPHIRSFRASYNPQTMPREKVNDASGSWFVCNSSEIADKVSAIAYVYARNLFESQHVPIGILQSYRGGTEIETWMSPKIFEDTELCKIAGRKMSIDSTVVSQYHSLHFNGQINPLVNFPVKGFIFYQGESNVKRAPEYRLLMKKLIEDWRKLWKMGDLPFYYIQLFNIYSPSVYEESNWADCREQQALLLSDCLPHTGMAVIIDTNEEALNPDGNINIHPRNKKPVGERLARIALKNTYHVDILADGPVLSSYKFSNDTVYLYFKNQGSGLRIKTGDTFLKGFVISGNDKKFYIAQATICNDSTVVVTSASVLEPVAVRYAWARNPICNLYNSEDLPAMPFRTDTWKSSFVYTDFPSFCTLKSNDATLITIRINGVTIDGFHPQQLMYDYFSEDSGYQDIVAITNSPFAKMEKVENFIDKKVVLKVTAEDGSVLQYEINMKASTPVANAGMKTIFVYQKNKDLIIKNNIGQSYDMMIYDLMGHCIISDYINGCGEKNYSTSPGIYLIQLKSPEQNECIKFLLK